VKVDYTYPLNGGQLAKHYNIPHYSLVSSVGADKSSFFLYPKTKGQVEDALSKLQLNNLSIYRPGQILNRENGEKRFGETLLKFVPFFPRIESKDLAKALRIEAENTHAKNLTNQKAIIFENKDILNILNPKKK